MPWGSAELEMCRPVSGAGEVALPSVTEPAPGDDTQPSWQPKAALRPVVYLTAEAGCPAGASAAT